MVKIIVKTSKAKVLMHRDQLVDEANKAKTLVKYSDEMVETLTDTYLFRVMPVEIPPQVFSQIYDLDAAIIGTEGEADISDVIQTLESSITRLNDALEKVMGPRRPKVEAPVEQPKEELPTFTGTKLENPVVETEQEEVKEDPKEDVTAEKQEKTGQEE